MNPIVKTDGVCRKSQQGHVRHLPSEKPCATVTALGSGSGLPLGPRTSATSHTLTEPGTEQWARESMPPGPGAVLTGVSLQMYIALASVHALVLCGLQFIACVRGQWTGRPGGRLLLLVPQ